MGFATMTVWTGSDYRLGAAEDSMHGYHGRILHVNLTKGQTSIDTFEETFAQTYLGGNGFAIRLLYERLAPGVDALAPENMIVFAVGPATDTPIPGAKIGRASCRE